MVKGSLQLVQLNELPWTLPPIHHRTSSPASVLMQPQLHINVGKARYEEGISGKEETPYMAKTLEEVSLRNVALEVFMIRLDGDLSNLL